MKRKVSKRRPRDASPFGKILTELMTEKKIGVREAGRDWFKRHTTVNVQVKGTPGAAHGTLDIRPSHFAQKC